MKMDRNVIRLSNGPKGLLDKVENGISVVWPLTLSAFSMKSDNYAQFRLQRNVVAASKAQS